MTTRKIAVPSNAPGGLAAERSEHFGHCDLFTVVTLSGREIVGVATLTPPPHAAGGCLAPIGLLRDEQVAAIVVSGMGKRPLAGFQEAGIEVFWAPQESATSVNAVIAGLLEDSFQVMAPVQACTGHNCQAH
ncbi:MAG: dinitrogenase iron-molybdenum cofactor biosynthesis protein [Desulfobulbaceae bacterium]|nr:dinitrogenase iron-molybdenum cofactor biosynthesis protein [Desulfobulbaceae bacterium]